MRREAFREPAGTGSRRVSWYPEVEKKGKLLGNQRVQGAKE